VTRERIAQLLDILVLELGNGLPAPGRDLPGPVDLRPGNIHYAQAPIPDAEWAYVKGLAASAVLQLRDRLKRDS